MCTLTIIPTTAGVRVAFNRDEQRSRGQALPPKAVAIGSQIAVYPVDPESGGTWLAASSAGLIFALLNGNPINRRTYRATHSRGRIIPALLSADSVGHAVHELEHDFNLPAFAPFRLVALQQNLITNFVWTGSECIIESEPFGTRALMFTSSGLGDHLVSGVRSDLFTSLFAAPRESWPTAQDTYHAHRWVDRPELSVNMCRADAHTVSHAIIETDRESITFRYRPAAPDRPADETLIRFSVGLEAKS